MATTDDSTKVIGAEADSHTHTIIMLHGRAYNGTDFASDLLGNVDITKRLPDWKWVFASADFEWSAQFQEEMRSWFDIRSLTDPEYEKEMQLSGLRKSVDRVLQIIDREVQLLDGHVERLVFGGISQGAATAYMTMLHLVGRYEKIGGFVFLHGWVPFASDFRQLLSHPALDGVRDIERVAGRLSCAGQVARTLTGLGPRLQGDPLTIAAFADMAVFWAHGEDDAVVEPELGNQALEMLAKIFTYVLGNEYEGADQDGHGIKEPGELDDIVGFLMGVYYRFGD